MDWLGPKIAIVIVILLLITYLPWNIDSYIFGLPFVVLLMWGFVFFAFIGSILFSVIKDRRDNQERR